MIPQPARRGGERATTPAYVYLLRSHADGRYYLGWTTNLSRRLEEHNIGMSLYTKARGPWELIAYEKYDGPEAAKHRERVLKHNPRMLSLLKKRALNVFRTAKGGPGQVVG